MTSKYLVIVSCLLFLGSCAVETAEKSTTETAIRDENPSAEELEADSITPVPTQPTSTSTETEDTDPEPETPSPSPAVTAPGGGLSTSSLGEERMSTVMEQIARDLEKDSLAYRADLGQDCSGIYHKIKDMVQQRIAVLGNREQYTYPEFASVRSSRQIADWYHRHNNLHIVQNALADRNKIRPGSVMFYGRTDESYSDLDITLLANADKFFHDGTNGKIMHIAVVTSVEKDEAGNVSKYTIMHGRNKRYPASRSAGNWEGPGSYTRQHQKFPFGNWNQQWVAIANIETPAQ